MNYGSDPISSLAQAPEASAPGKAIDVTHVSKRPRDYRRVGRSPPLRRLWRVPRMLMHFIVGLATVLFVFPSLDANARRVRIRRWSRRLLHLLGIDIRMAGTLGSGRGSVMVVANHISWLDIFVLHAVGPVRFIAKAEIARWPIAGRLVRGVGTLFIERSRRRDTHRVNQEVTRALEAGDIVAVFPEGTTTDGTRLLPFKGSLLQPIVDAGGDVRPVAICYRTPDGSVSVAAAYVDDITFLGSFWRICGERALVVETIALDVLPARDRHRRELAREAEGVIRAALALPASGSGPGTRAGRAAESP